MEKKKVSGISGLQLRRFAAAACAVLAVATAVVFASPQARAYAANVADSLGITIFRLTADDMKEMKENGKVIDVDQMKEGQSEGTDDLILQKSGKAAETSSGVVLSEKLDQGVQIESKVNSFEITEELKNSMKENSKTINVSDIKPGEKVTAGGITIENAQK